MRLLDSCPVSALEAAAAAALLVAVGAAAYGSHVINGGFLHDDWAYLADAKFAHSFADAVESNRGSTGNRILNAYYLALAQRTFGTHMHVQLAWMTLLAVLMSFLLYIVLRSLRVARLHAAAIASLTLLFPAAATNRLWITAGGAQLSISLYLLGLIVALRGLRLRGVRAIGVHAVAVSLYIASLLEYEICAVAMLSSVLLYRLRAPWRDALRRWPVDIAAVTLTLLYMQRGRVQVVHPFHDQVTHARVIAAQARALLASLGIPNGAQRLPNSIVLALAALAVVVWLALDRDAVARNKIRYWLTFLLAGVITVAVGYATFVPLDLYYSPLSPGLAGRVNILAAAGYVIVLYALVTVATLAFRGLRHGAELWLAVVVTGTVFLVAVVFVRQLGIEKAVYDRSWALQSRVLHVLRRNVETPAPGTTLYAFGTPPDVAPGVPVFRASWDLTGAIRMLWHDYSLFAIPDTTLTGMSCEASGVKPSGFLYPAYSSRYGHSLFVDANTGRSAVIRSRLSCRRLLPTFTPLAGA